MVTIPPNQVTQEDLNEWWSLKQQLEQVKPLFAKELLLRRKIFGGLFPNPREGVNNLDMTGGAVLKATHKIERKVDPALLKSNYNRFTEAGLAVDALVRYKPELETTNYKKLTAEQQATFDECLIIKDASPELVLVLPKPPKE